MIQDYVGLSAEAIELIELHRLSAMEHRSDIIVRVLTQNLSAEHVKEKGLDLGQGVFLSNGEKPILFLSESSKRSNRPDAIAEVKLGKFYMDGKEVISSKGSVLTPAMRSVQEKLNHRNKDGEIISLSAWRQWYVIRDGKIFSMLELKDPKLAHRRQRDVFTLEDLESIL